MTLLLSFGLYGQAQVHVFKGNSTFTSNILYTWDGKYLYKGNSTFTSNILYTWDVKHLYKGNSTFTSNILFTYDGSIPIAVLIQTL